MAHTQPHEHTLITPARLYDFAVIGGDLLGLSVAMALTSRHPRAKIVVLEHGQQWGPPANAPTSGVLHSGIMSKPGSLKAIAARNGNRAMIRFCEEHGIAYDICGKLIVATDPGELDQLDQIHCNGLASGLKVVKMSGSELREVEPHVNGLAAVQVLDTGIVDYRRAAQAMAYCLESRGIELRLRTRTGEVLERDDKVVVQTSNEAVHSRFLINCAPSQGDQSSRRGRRGSGVRIVPLPGERYALRPEKQSLIRHQVYPVPNPSIPFQRVHFMRLIDGNILAGSTAATPVKPGRGVKADRYLRDFVDVAARSAVWSVTRRHFPQGARELIRSWGNSAFIHSLQRLVPEIEPTDLVPTQFGTLAQVLLVDGNVVDDFVIVREERSLDLYTASSLSATAALEIGEMVAARMMLSQ